MSTAIERAEAWLEHPDAMLLRPLINGEELTELVRLAKLGARVEQCEVQRRERRNVVRTPDRTLMHAEFLLA